MRTRATKCPEITGKPATMAAALHRPEILLWRPIHIAQLDLPCNATVRRVLRTGAS